MKKIKGLLYCTKAKPLLSMVEYLYGDEFKQKYECSNDEKYLKQMGVDQILNGTIVAGCEIEVESIFYDLYGDLDWQHEVLPSTDSMSIIDLERYSCLDRKELDNYLQGKNGYALHISNLKVFDEPRELSEYYYYYDVRLTKAPQNMRYAIDDEDNEYILISIQPQWLCKILNGEKTIEVRKQVLNCMKGEWE